MYEPQVTLRIVRSIYALAMRKMSANDLKTAIYQHKKTFVHRRCFAATCRDHQRSLTCMWDVNAAMFNAKACRSLADIITK